MIRVNLGNRTLGVTFQREFEIEEVEKSKGDGSISLTKQGRPTATFCELHTLEEREVEVEGEKVKRWESLAIVARSRALIATKGRIKDQFTYEKGRKIALARALRAYGLSRDARLLVWTAYFERPRIKSHLMIVEAPEPAVRILEGSPGAPMSDATGFVESPPMSNHPHIHSLDLHAGEL